MIAPRPPPRNAVLIGHCLEKLLAIPDESVHCCVTSPPYFGLRDYGIRSWMGGDAACDHADAEERGPGREPPAVGTCRRCGAWRGQLGLEEELDQYVEHLVLVFREVRRVLRPDGTLWLNVGDGYARQGGSSPAPGKSAKVGATRRAVQRRNCKPPRGMKSKDLMTIPHLVAAALRADGWYLRDEVIWHRPNAMPTSATDRGARKHEFVFLLTKNEHYYYDDSAAPPGSVWTIPTKPYKGAHFAAFPPGLPNQCIRIGTSKRGACQKCGEPWRRQKGEDWWRSGCACGAGEPVPCVVLDPFAGSGTTLAAVRELGRDFIGIEVNPEYEALIQERLQAVGAPTTRRSAEQNRRRPPLEGLRSVYPPRMTQNSTKQVVVLKISEIKRDPDLQVRVATDDATVNRYAEAIRQGQELAPVVVFDDGATKWLSDGNHSTLAHAKAGKLRISADLRSGNRRDALNYACSANSRHGLPLSSDDKRRIATIRLTDPEWSQESDRAIAKKIGASHTFVSNVRRELSAKAEGRGNGCHPGRASGPAPETANTKKERGENGASKALRGNSGKTGGPVARGERRRRPPSAEGAEARPTGTGGGPDVQALAVDGEKLVADLCALRPRFRERWPAFSLDDAAWVVERSLAAGLETELVLQLDLAQRAVRVRSAAAKAEGPDSPVATEAGRLLKASAGKLQAGDVERLEHLLAAATASRSDEPQNEVPEQLAEGPRATREDLEATLVNLGFPRPRVRRVIGGFGDRIGREPLPALIAAATQMMTPARR